MIIKSILSLALIFLSVTCIVTDPYCSSDKKKDSLVTYTQVCSIKAAGTNSAVACFGNVDTPNPTIALLPNPNACSNAAPITVNAAPPTNSPSPNPSSSVTSTNSSTSTSSSSTSNTSKSGTSGSTDATSDGLNVTFDEFSKAVQDSKYPAPSKDQYTAFVGGIPKSGITTKRELAAFLAQILHESKGLTEKEQIICKDNKCPGQYDSGPGGQFYGRGYIQLSWKANYEAASKDIYGDDRLVQKPQLVATDENAAWATAFYYWKTRVHDAEGVQQGKFGATTKAINGGIECSAPNQEAKKRFENYNAILAAWKITDTPDASGCYN